MQKKDAVELVVGYHQLEGQLLPLKKPLAMLEKTFDEAAASPMATGYQVNPK